ncbi:MAG: hypothetical protein F2813_06205 [Actinobacteria bacterium]|nr:hypothetical protein [Actinomycetota bacterium]
MPDRSNRLNGADVTKVLIVRGSSRSPAKLSNVGERVSISEAFVVPEMIGGTVSRIASTAARVRGPMSA